MTSEPTNLGSGDPARRRTDYYPGCLDHLADDVTLEASAMNGAAQGRDAVRSTTVALKSLYEYQDINFTGDLRQQFLHRGLHHSNPVPRRRSRQEGS
jgi:hypothetical protein